MDKYIINRFSVAIKGRDKLNYRDTIMYISCQQRDNDRFHYMGLYSIYVIGYFR